jgi:DNA-binding transcriptional regulator LsrR (DeoR family)
VGPAELVQAAMIARRYFLEGRAKTEIAKEFAISRFKVARILDAGLAAGIVKIEIALPAELDADLSDRLRSAYGLRHALVVNTPDEPESSLRAHLGRVTAELLGELVGEDDVIGIGWGRTLYALADQLTSLPPCPVVQMTGVVGTVSDNSMELIRRITSMSGGPAYPIYAPLVLPDAATARGLRRQPGVAAAMSQFGNITKAVVAVGSWDPPNSQLREALPPHERARLQARGVRAEICSTLIGADGEPIRTDLGERGIAVSADQLRRIPERVIVAGGRTKTGAILAVLRGGFATSLVTDAGVARSLLDAVPHRP